MTSNLLCIRSSDSLEPLLHEARGDYRQDFETIIVDSADLTSEENQHWQQRIERLYFACGCEQGALAGGIGVVISIAWFVLLQSGDSSIYRLLGIAGAATLLMAAVGKVLGLWIARIRLRMAIRALHSILSDRQREASAVRACAQLKLPPSRDIRLLTIK